ncbi:MAG: type IV pili methyl-accepting chemotaxis transducer N-terminal domain-containing protein, partial [Pseudomonadota bacterium]
KDSYIDQPSEDIIDLADADADRGGEGFVDLPAKGKRSSSAFGLMDFKFAGLPLIIAGLVLSMIALVWALMVNAQQSSRESKYIEQSSQLLMLSQRIAKDAREAVLGQKIAFGTLKDSRNQFETIVTNLRNGSADAGIPPTPGDSHSGQALASV